ncbi:MAG: VanZ family protein [Limnobacter sp.]|nr:VanZ family protein [Limnobacter sp.]
MRAADPSRWPLAVAGSAYLLFVVYQSLAGVGLETCALPLTQQGPTLSLSDGIGNFVAYLPLGMLVAAWGGVRGRPVRLIGAFVAIAGFSLAMETVQACMTSRVSSWYDWATNSAGGLLGLLAPSLAAGRAGAQVASAADAGRAPASPGPLYRLREDALFWPTLLCVGAWLALSLWPWRFTLDIGTLRSNLSFLRGIDLSALTVREAWQLLHWTAGWLAAGLAIRALLPGRGPAAAGLALVLGLSLVGQLMLVRSSLSFAELAGMVAAFAACALLPSGVRGAALARALPLCALVSVAAYQLAPRRGGWLVGDFIWWPQLGRGGLLSALAMTLLFSWFAFALILSLRWAAARGVVLGRRPLVLSLLGALALLALEVVQRWIPGRIGDTSAPLVMLLAFLVGWTLTGVSAPASGPVARRSSRAEEAGRRKTRAGAARPSSRVGVGRPSKGVDARRSSRRAAARPAPDADVAQPP